MKIDFKTSNHQLRHEYFLILKQKLIILIQSFSNFLICKKIIKSLEFIAILNLFKKELDDCL